MTSELKPCPCCGGRAEEIHLRHMGHSGHRIFCVECLITTETMHSRDSVVERWNRRRTDGMIAWLDAEIEKCKESPWFNIRSQAKALRQCKRQLQKLLDGMGVGE